MLKLSDISDKGNENTWENFIDRCKNGTSAVYQTSKTALPTVREVEIFPTYWQNLYLAKIQWIDSLNI